MRIIAGLARGRIIKAPKGTATRPTTDKVREAIFSSLSDRVVGSRVLDIYAGSGALGLEALSRGAIETVFVDYSNHSIETIKANLTILEFSQKAIVVKNKVEKYLQSYNGQPFDLIFMDAPYKISVALLKEVVDKALMALSKQGTMVIEHLKNNRLEGHFKIMKSKNYGQTTITYLERK